jgi:hypothetical protein
MEVLKMDPNQPGSKALPDFKELNDRIIANPSSSPQLVIKTNLDPKDPTEENPYVEKGKVSNSEQFNEYFEE